jgi:hypothetical protein
VEIRAAPGEWYSPTHRIPTKPKAYARTGVSRDDFIDFTPEASQQSAVQTTKLTRVEEPTLLCNHMVAFVTMLIAATIPPSW